MSSLKWSKLPQGSTLHPRRIYGFLQHNARLDLQNLAYSWKQLLCTKEKSPTKLVTKSEWKLAGSRLVCTTLWPKRNEGNKNCAIWRKFEFLYLWKLWLKDTRNLTVEKKLTRANGNKVCRVLNPLIQEWNVKESIYAVVIDTTAANRWWF